MKKSAILFAMMLAIALWFGSTANAELPLLDNDTTATINSGTTPAEICGDTECGAGDIHPSDIEEVIATSDGTEIIVTVTTCGDYDNVVPGKRMVKYRLHIDHKPFGFDAANYDSAHEFTPDDEDTEDDCETSSDDGVKYRVHKNGKRRTYGPGEVQEFAPDVLIFTVPYDGLRNPAGNNPVVAGNTVHLWMDVQYKEICDRAPDTFTDDEEPFDDTCSKPEIPDEVLTIQLQ